MSTVAIIGAGLSGLTTAIALSQHSTHFEKIDIFDKGTYFGARKCYLSKGDSYCHKCENCQLLCGIGGAATINGGKLCHFPSGSKLFSESSKSTIENIIESTSFLVKKKNTISNDTHLNNLSRVFTSNNSRIKPYVADILLKNDMTQLIIGLLNEINYPVKVLTKHNIHFIEYTGNNWRVSYNHRNRISNNIYDIVVVATGRSNVGLIKRIFNHNNIDYEEQAIDLGIRIEFPIHSEHVPDILGLNDPKITHKISFSDDIRTFCMAWGGHLAPMKLFSGINVDGHFGRKISDKCNIAFMHRKYLRQTDHLAIGEHYINSISFNDVPSLQTYNSFYNNSYMSEHSVCASSIKADVNYISRMIPIDSYELIRDFSYNFLQYYDLLNDNINVYAPSIDRYWPRIKCNQYGETNIENFYVAGDIRGWARGYLQAIWSGYLSAAGILEKIGIKVLEKETIPSEL